MVRDGVGSLGWLRKRIEDADTGFLREMVRQWRRCSCRPKQAPYVVGPYRQTSADRVNRRNRYGEHRWDTRVGTIALAIPRLRKGSYFPN